MEKILKWLHLRRIRRILSLFLVNHLFSGTRYFEIKRKLLNGIGFQIGEGTKACRREGYFSSRLFAY